MLFILLFEICLDFVRDTIDSRAHRQKRQKKRHKMKFSSSVFLVSCLSTLLAIAPASARNGGSVRHSTFSKYWYCWLGCYDTHPCCEDFKDKGLRGGLQDALQRAHEAEEYVPSCKEIFDVCAGGDDVLTGADYETCAARQGSEQEVADDVALFTESYPDGLTKEEACSEDTMMKKTKGATKEADMDYREAALKECTDVFERMDIDKDGELSLEELETVVDSEVKANVADTKIQEFVDAMGNLDLNNDEIIDKEEFMSACLKN